MSVSDWWFFKFNFLGVFCFNKEHVFVKTFLMIYFRSLKSRFPDNIYLFNVLAETLEKGVKYVQS